MQRPVISTNDVMPKHGIHGVVDYRQFRSSGFRPIETIPEREWKDAAAGEKFMSELLVVQISEDMSPTAYPKVPLGNNGEFVWFVRGVPISMPRYFVEIMAHSKSKRYVQKENPDKDAMEGFITRTITGQDYSFQVLHEPSGDVGRGWLARVMQEGC